MNLLISKTNIIKTVDDWKQFAPPMSKEKHWKKDRSAMSLAEFMTDKKQVKKLEQVLEGLKYKTRGYIQCTPEAVTSLPGSGKGRCHDLLMIGNDFVVGIEAKVTERFGESIAKEQKGASGNKLYRIDSLAKDLFGCEVNEDYEGLKYQLLTGVMGTLIEAVKNSKSKALFLVIVFTDGITAQGQKAKNNNDNDYSEFCKYLGLEENGGTITKLNINLTIKKIEVSLKS